MRKEQPSYWFLKLSDSENQSDDGSKDPILKSSEILFYQDCETAKQIDGPPTVLREEKFLFIEESEKCICPSREEEGDLRSFCT